MKNDTYDDYHRLLDSDDAYDLRRGTYDLLRRVKSLQGMRCAMFVVAARQRGVGETETAMGVVTWGYN